MPSKTRKMHSIDELRALVAPVAMKYGVYRVYIFGSVARGDSDDGSDYDFCIEPGRIEDYFKLAGFFSDLKNAVGSEIDVVGVDALDPEFLRNIRSEGVLVYEEGR